MTLLRRISFTVESWLNALLNRASDPAAELDYSYERLRDELQDLKVRLGREPEGATAVEIEEATD